MAKAKKDRRPQTKPSAAKRKPVAVKKLTAKSAPVKKAPPVKVPAKPEMKAPAPAPAPLVGDRPRPKGITIISNKPSKKPKVKKPVIMPNLGAPLIKPGAKRPKPLIASGPNAPVLDGVGRGIDPSKLKTHLGKKDLDQYRAILLRKRLELVGDINTMEGEALQGSSGSLSHLPQHTADQGSDAYDQSLSLGLAQVDRNLIREIDDALARIQKGTFGMCEVTGKPISRERLDELPWTRYSIEGARERERRSLRGIA